MSSQVEFGLHPSDELLETYAMDSASEQECVEVEEHLLVCERCQTALQQADEYIRAVRQAASQLRSATRQVKPTRRFWPLAAVVVAGITIAIAVSWRGSRSRFQEVELSVQRGNSNSVIAPAVTGQRLALSIDLTEIPAAPAYRIDLVNAKGADVWSGNALATNGRLRTEISSTFAPGLYWVRVYGDSRSPVLLREYGLQVRR